MITFWILGEIRTTGKPKGHFTWATATNAETENGRESGNADTKLLPSKQTDASFGRFSVLATLVCCALFWGSPKTSPSGVAENQHLQTLHTSSGKKKMEDNPD